MKLGIMGGTFDPVHYGHILTAKEVMEREGLDRVLFIPTGNPGHKKDKKVTDAQLRYEMLKSATADFKGFEVSDIEIARDGYTYAIDTLRTLKQSLPQDTELFYIIGADVIRELDTWKDYKEDFALSSFIAVERPGISREDFLEAVEKMTELGAKINFVKVLPREISSSGIREKIRQGKSVENLLPEKVLQTIRERRLYKE